MDIRDYDKRLHLNTLRACIEELQDFERRLDPRMPPGADMVDAYLAQMMDRCQSCVGKILVAELGGNMVGFVTILTQVKSDEPDDGDLVYGLVPDLVVLEGHRGAGIGRALLAAAEAHAKASHVTWLRIGVMAENQAAKSLYHAVGFSDLHVTLEKQLAPPG